MTGKNILITGGAGFIGSHISDELVSRGHKVIIADNYSAPNSGYKNNSAEYIECNILSDDFEYIFETRNIDICIHLAANASVVNASKNPEFDAVANIIGSIKVIELCKKYKIEKLMVASTAAVYGAPEYLPMDEFHSTNVLSQYGLSKLTMEKYLILSGQDYIIFRFANVYGERQTNHGEAGVISIFTKLMKEDSDLYIDGDGEQTRDFICVKDIARVVAIAVESSVNNEIINVSTNSAISINTLFAEMAKMLGYTKNPIYREARIGDIKHSRLSNEKLKSLLGVEDFISLKDGVTQLLGKGHSL